MTTTVPDGVGTSSPLNLRTSGNSSRGASGETAHVIGTWRCPPYAARWADRSSRDDPERTPWSAGAYKLVALSILEDLAGNQIGKPFEIDVFERADRLDDPPATTTIPFDILP